MGSDSSLRAGASVAQPATMVANGGCRAPLRRGAERSLAFGPAPSFPRELSPFSARGVLAHTPIPAQRWPHQRNPASPSASTQIDLTSASTPIASAPFFICGEVSLNGDIPDAVTSAGPRMDGEGSGHKAREGVARSLRDHAGDLHPGALTLAPRIPAWARFLLKFPAQPVLSGHGRADSVSQLSLDFVSSSRSPVGFRSPLPIFRSPPERGLQQHAHAFIASCS